MKIVLVTTRAASDIVRSIVKDLRRSDCSIEVITLEEVPIASLATTKDIANYLSRDPYKRILRDADIILIPGLVVGSTELIERVVNAEVFKGTKYAGDIPVLIDYIMSGGRLSKEKPADEVMENYLRQVYDERVREALSTSPTSFYLRGVKFPVRPPPINLLYEVVVRNKIKEGLNEVLNVVNKLRRYNYQGIVLGLEAGNYDTAPLRKLIREIRSYDSELLIGIDAPIDLIVRDDALLSDVDILMNLDVINRIDLIRKYSSELKDKAIVVIAENLAYIKSIITELSTLGIDKIIIDAVLKPPLLGLIDSIIKYKYVSKNMRVPLMMGLSNVYELMDVDSHGVIATLMTLGFELGISNMLVTEESYKAKGAIKEAYIARNMIYRAYVRRSPPINVNLNLLILKDKRPRSAEVPRQSPITNVVNVGKVPPVLDREYYLRIYVDHKKKLIVVDVHKRSNNKVMIRFTGEDALSLGRYVIRNIGLSKEHAIYLGYELSKAEIALKLGKNYVQDEPLFSFSYED